MSKRPLLIIDTDETIKSNVNAIIEIKKTFKSDLDKLHDKMIADKDACWLAIEAVLKEKGLIETEERPDLVLQDGVVYLREKGDKDEDNDNEDDHPLERFIKKLFS